MTSIKLVSAEDQSKNYIIPTSDGGYFESRFVQRSSSSYFIVYLSSHSGCNQSCRMCHLTQTGQTMMTSAKLKDYIEQAENVLKDVNFEELKAQGLTRVKFSFMARGEPLLNTTIQNQWEVLRRSLRNLVPGYFDVEFNISTIYPKAFDKKLSDIFKTSDVTIYYSIYSYNIDFRKKWLGKAICAGEALRKLDSFRRNTPCKVKLHSAFIEGENDSQKDVLTLDTILAFEFGEYEFNIVRYNPYNEKFGRETSQENLLEIRKILDAKVKSRVGKDVYASCGMFYNGA